MDATDGDALLCHEGCSVEQLQDEFLAADRNSSGRLESENVQDWMAAELGRAPSEAEVAGLMRRMDLDSSGDVSLDEWLAWHRGESAALNAGAGARGLALTLLKIAPAPAKMLLRFKPQEAAIGESARRSGWAGFGVHLPTRVVSSMALFLGYSCALEVSQRAALTQLSCNSPHARIATLTQPSTRHAVPRKTRTATIAAHATSVAGTCLLNPQRHCGAPPSREAPTAASSANPILHSLNYSSTCTFIKAIAPETVFGGSLPPGPAPGPGTALIAASGAVGGAFHALAEAPALAWQRRCAARGLSCSLPNAVTGLIAPSVCKSNNIASSYKRCREPLSRRPV